MILTHIQLREYILSQIKEIESYKWIESEKNGRDIGDKQAAKEWIEKYASSFKDYYFKYKFNQDSDI